MKRRRVHWTSRWLAVELRICPGQWFEVSLFTLFGALNVTIYLLCCGVELRVGRERDEGSPTLAV